MSDSTYPVGVIHTEEGGTKRKYPSGTECDFESGSSLKLAGTAFSASAAEVNRVCDVSARIVNLTAAALALTEALHDGKIITVNKADGTVITLPAASGSGAAFCLIVGTTITSNNLDIKVADADDVMTGTATVCNDTDNSVSGFETAADSDTVRMNGTTTGGIKGDMVELVDIAANLWYVRVHSSATGAEATPFAATVA